MTAKSFLFVNETIRDAIEMKFDVKVEVEVPEEWNDLWDDSEFPEDGKARIHTKNGRRGQVSWKTIFDVEQGHGGKYIQASYDENSLGIIWFPENWDDGKIYKFVEHDLMISGEKRTLVSLVNHLRSPEIDLTGTIGDLVFQIECEFRLNGMNPEGIDGLG